MRSDQIIEFEHRAECPLTQGSCVGGSLERRYQMRSDRKFKFEVHAERPLTRGSSLTSCTGRNLEGRSRCY